MSDRGGDRARRLAAVLFVDVVGFSGMMAEDEDGTLAALAALRDAVLEPEVARRGGRVVKSLGDGFMLEYSSTAAAVASAVAIQEAAEARRAREGSNRGLRLRIGIHSGDVIEAGGDILGDGVNLAARLEPLAEPGGICLSGKVRDEIRGSLSIEMRSLGRRRLKGMPETVEVWLVPPPGVEPEPTRPARWTARAARKRGRASVIIVAALAAALSLLGAFLGFERLSSTRVETVAGSRPSVAVAPFSSERADSDEVRFAAGLAEDLITDLSREPGLFVIARGSAFAAWREAPSIEAFAERLDVSYVIEGSVRRSRDRLRVNVQLVRAASGEAIWGRRFDVTLDQLFATQTRMAERITTVLAPGAADDASPAPEPERTTSVAALDAFLHGRVLYRRGTPEDNAAAAAAFERTLVLDPDYAPARTALARVYVRAATGTQAFAEALDIHWSAGLAKAWRLLAEVGRDEPGARTVRSILALRKHQHDRAVAEAEASVALQPSDADALAALAEARIFRGEIVEGRSLVDRLLAHDPLFERKAHRLRAIAAFVDDDLEAASRHLSALAADGGELYGEMAGLHAAVLGLSGRVDAARAAFRTFSEGYLQRPAMSWTVAVDRFRNPRFHTWRNVDLAWAIFTHPFTDPTVQSRFARGLEVAGAPVGIGGYIAMHRGNRMSNAEIREALWKAEVTGADFWLSERIWRQRRTADGAVRHHGVAIHAGPPDYDRPGQAEAREDLLCETWTVDGRSTEFCSTVFRVLDPRARQRWGDLVLVTDVGPFPFSTAPIGGGAN